MHAYKKGEIEKRRSCMLYNI